MLKVLLVGASSAIAEATARCYAARGASLHLLGRDGERLAMMARDLEIRGAAAVTSTLLDVAQPFDADALIANAHAALNGIDIALFAHGVLPDQNTCEHSVAQLRLTFEINTLSTLALLTPLASLMQSHGHGTLAVLSSVAGDRGRQSNYVYGASKASLDAFLSGLRNRLAQHGVQVLTIKPGLVMTPMTAHLKHGPLWATPDTIATGIVRAIDTRRDVVYLPSFWRVIMLVIRGIPERWFKHLNL